MRHHKHAFPSMAVHPFRWDVKSNSIFSPLAFLLQYTSFKSCTKKSQGGRSEEERMFISLIWGDDLLFLSPRPCILRTPIFTVPAYSLNWSKEVSVLSWQISYLLLCCKQRIKTFLAHAVWILWHDKKQCISVQFPLSWVVWVGNSPFAKWCRQLKKQSSERTFSHSV